MVPDPSPGSWTARTTTTSQPPTPTESVPGTNEDTGEFFLAFDGRIDVALRDADANKTTVVIKPRRRRVRAQWAPSTSRHRRADRSSCSSRGGPRRPGTATRENPRQRQQHQRPPGQRTLMSRHRYSAATHGPDLLFTQRTAPRSALMGCRTDRSCVSARLSSISATPSGRLSKGAIAPAWNASPRPAEPPRLRRSIVELHRACWRYISMCGRP
jgi:hypothetical protein